MISFVDQDHMIVYDVGIINLMKHSTVVFFRFHLQGQESYSKYFSEEMIAKQEGFAWGVYEK